MKEKIFNHLNSDLNQLIIHILLEGYFRKQEVFTLNQFIKGDFWDSEEIAEEIKDTNDYGNIEDMVLQQIRFIISDLKIGKIKRISVNHLSSLVEEVVADIVSNGKKDEDEIMYYSSVIDEIFDLRKKKDKQIEKDLEAGKKYDSTTSSRLDFSSDDSLGDLGNIVNIISSNIEIEIIFDSECVKRTLQNIKDYIKHFAQDDYKDQKPTYKKNRPYFSKQIENFYDYIKKLPIIDRGINIPFSALKETGFEIIKILAFLEHNQRVKICDWGDAELWNVKFRSQPITLASLTGQKENDTYGSGLKEVLNSNEDDEDSFSYDGGISSPYENTDLELFILKKIVLEYKQRDDRGFAAKELSFNNNSLKEICQAINRLIEDKILFLSANTRPERFEEDGTEGLDDKSGFINWGLVEKLDKNPQDLTFEKNFVAFDVELLDVVKLKGIIDISIEEFMGDRVFNEFGNLAELPQDAYSYKKQREVLLNKLNESQKDEICLNLNDFVDEKVDVLKTLLALEKENYLIIKELKNNPDSVDAWEFWGVWLNKDNPSAKIQLLRGFRNKEEPLTINIEKIKPHTLVKDGMGYFKFHKEGPNIKIGKENTRQFKLLRCLTEPNFGIQKTIEAVFEAIKQPRDDKDSRLSGLASPQRKTRMLEIIDYTKKELQKIKELQGKINYRMDDNKQNMWLK